jgi:hypothetical protein
MSQSSYKFVKTIAGRTCFAEITVEVLRQTGCRGVKISDAVFSWLKELYGPNAWEWSPCDDWRKAAARGAEEALALSGNADMVGIVIQKIHGILVDTTAPAVAHAACYATLKALGSEVDFQPRIENNRLVFPGVS